MTTALQPATPYRMGVAVLLVYGLRVPVPRDGHPGFNLTVQRDGAVWVEPVGFGNRRDASRAARDLQCECDEIGLALEPLPLSRDRSGFVVRRRRPNS